jgi:alkylhydroperoxidase family enzyme
VYGALNLVFDAVFSHDVVLLDCSASHKVVWRALTGQLIYLYIDPLSLSSRPVLTAGIIHAPQRTDSQYVDLMFQIALFRLAARLLTSLTDPSIGLLHA